MPSNTTAWIAFSAAILAASLTGVSGFVLHYKEAKEKRNYEIMIERKQALFDVLQVIDLVYANEPLGRTPPLNPKEWDISIARNATNKMLIYCENPQRTVEAFYKAVGLYNPDTQASAGVNLIYLDEFRK